MSRIEREPNSSAECALVVLSTAPDEAVAKRIALALLERRLVACVNVVPGAISHYRWQGSIEEAREVVMIAKTTSGRLVDLERAFHELHPYETPEFLVLATEHIGAKYLAWLSSETR